MYRLDEPSKNKVPKNIFVGSMADLFGDWVPDEWIEKVFAACRQSPWHRYLFLTKAPWRYIGLYDAKKLMTGDNIWYGSTITNNDDPYMYVKNKSINKFISIEPVLGAFGRMVALKVSGAKLVIIGAETGRRPGKVIPERVWIRNIVDVCRDAGIAVFMKDSIAPYWDGQLITELPWRA
jgi:protein gp37